jgi:hypothetical protein
MTEKRGHLTSRKTLVSRHLTPEIGKRVFTPLYLSGALGKKPHYLQINKSRLHAHVVLGAWRHIKCR